MSSGDVELEHARERIQELLARADRDPATAVSSALDDLEMVRALILIAKRDLAHLERAKLRLRQVGVRAGDVAALGRVVSRGMGRGPARAASQPSADAVLVRNVLPDAPVGESVVVPECWSLGPSGLFTDYGDRVSPVPVLLTRRHVDVVSHDELVTVAWRRGGEWHHETVERSTIAGGAKLLKLADRGLPVTAATKALLVAYLADFEITNEDALPVSSVAHTLGWIGGGFLLGSEFIAANGVGAIEFAAKDEGEEQLVGAISPHGSYTEWVAAAETASRYAAVRLALYVAFVPPLLEVLQAPNFVFELAGRTSCGKTTALQLCASVWGNPDLRSASAVLRTWDITRVFAEQAAALFNGLPLILDDTKTIADPKLATTVVYGVVAGHGRGRGSIAGTRRSASWRTVLISSGESPLTAFTEDGGTRARTLSLWGVPFGDDRQGAAVQALGAAICRHYGHAGSRFVDFLVRNRHRWQEFRHLHRDSHERYRLRAEGNAVGGRLAAYIATIDVTAALVHEALDLPWQYSDPIGELWAGLVADADEANPAVRALALVRTWAAAHEDAFFGRHRADARGRPRSPAGGWAGAWRDDEQWTHVDLLPTRLEDLLRQAGFEPTAVRRAWRDAGWIAVDSAGKGTVTARVGRHVERVVRLWRFALEPSVTQSNAQLPMGDQGPTDQ